MNSLQNSSKQFVSIFVGHTADGGFTPRFIEWSDGQAAKIERVAAVYQGGESLRYTCRVMGQWMYVVLPKVREA